METKYNYSETIKNLKTVKDIKKVVEDYKKGIKKIDEKYNTGKFEKELSEVEEKINYEKSFIEKLEFEGAELNKELISNAKKRLDEALENQKKLNDKINNKIENSKALVNKTVKLESGREVSQKEKDNMDKMDLKTKTVAILTQKNKSILEDLSKKQKELEEKTDEWNKLYTTHNPNKDHAQRMQSVNEDMDKIKKDISDLNEMKKVCDESLRELNESSLEEKKKIEDLSNILNRNSISNNKEELEKQENPSDVVELDEFLNKKEDNGKQEKVSENNNPYFDEFNEFLNKKGDKKDKEVEEDKDLKIIAIAGKKNNGFIKYQYVNEETEKTKKTEIYDKKFYKECYNEYRTMGFDNGTVEFDIDALKNVDPLLLKYLERTNPALALEVAEKISNHEDLSEFKDLIKYDMTEADKLTRKEKKLCRKIAKIARKNGLEVKNIEATKGFWGKLLDKILVRDPGDEFLVVPEEIKQLESGESEKEKSTNDFKEQIKQQVKQQLKEERNADVKEKEEISPEAQKNIEKAMENKRENLKELNKDEDEIEK